MTTTHTTTLNKTNNTIAITTTKTINVDEMFESLIGSDFHGCTRFVVPRSLEVDESLKKIRLKYLDVSQLDENNYFVERTKTLSLNAIVNAFAELVANEQSHCGNYLLSDLDHSDSCFAFLVLQQAIYGELHF